MIAFNRFLAVVAWVAIWCPYCRGNRHPNDDRTFVCHARCETEAANVFFQRQLGKHLYGLS